MPALQPPAPLVSTTERVFLGRQPIYDARREVCAYELLYRDGGESTAAAVTDGQQATAQVVVNYLLEMGISLAARGKPAFVNFTREGLESDLVDLLPPQAVVLEVLEDIEPDAQLCARLRSLAGRGFQIALDDFIYHPRWEPLLELADIVKIELRGRTPNQVRETIHRLQPHGVRMLAEKVESYEEFERCRRLGCELFQGYFLCRPEMLSAQKIPANKMALLTLVGKIRETDADVGEIELQIKSDAPTTIRLLRLVNSAAYSFPTKLGSIRQIIMMLGLERLSCLIATLALAAVDDKPAELAHTATNRAYFCEGLARATGKPDPGLYFLTGLCSTLEALFDRSFDSVFESMRLDDEIARAILHYEGSCGEALRAVLAYERGDWANARFEDIDEAEMTGVYWDTTSRSDQLVSILRS